MPSHQIGFEVYPTLARQLARTQSMLCDRVSVCGKYYCSAICSPLRLPSVLQTKKKNKNKQKDKIIKYLCLQRINNMIDVPTERVICFKCIKAKDECFDG